MMAGVAIRPPYGQHPRIFIWGLLEARLQHTDLMILGGLNEGSWPPDPGHDPWMSRPMMAAFGLPAPERKIGLAAHDFVQGFSAAHVVLTRSLRAEGTPTVPARWLQRLEDWLAIGSAVVAAVSLFASFIAVMATGPDMNLTSSQASSGCFVEEKIVGAEEKAIAIELRLYDELLGAISAVSGAILETARAVGEIDALASLATVAVRNRYVRPQLSEHAELCIEDGRHPVIEQIATLKE